MKTLFTIALAALVLVLVAVPQGARSSELIECLEETPTIFGTPGDDALTGTDESDVIVGLGGNDVIDAGDEADLVCGGPGNDRILTGDDGFLEPDVVSGDEGDDLIAAGSSDVFAVYMTATGAVSVDLGPGTATGAAGNDTLLGVVGVIGSEFDDTLRSNARSNLLAGMGGNDTIEGLSQDDWVSGDAGDDKLDGGPGSDWAWYGGARSAVRINLAQGMATGQGADQLKLLENVYGSRYADAITGNGARNTVYAQSGNDRVAGGSGPDQLDGEKGRDRVDGGAGGDRCMHAERRTRCP